MNVERSRKLVGFVADFDARAFEIGATLDAAGTLDRRGFFRATFEAIRLHVTAALTDAALVTLARGVLVTVSLRVTAAFATAFAVLARSVLVPVGLGVTRHFTVLARSPFVPVGFRVARGFTVLARSPFVCVGLRVARALAHAALVDDFGCRSDRR